VTTEDSTLTENHDAVVRDSFSRQTELFTGEKALFARYSAATDLWFGPVGPDMIVLDVACGAAHTAEQAAPHVRQVVGVDMTPALLETGAQRLREKGIDNVLLLEGDASALDFLDASFDVVFCRAALHHMPHPEKAIAEMARVCKPGGRVVVNDMIAVSAHVRDAFDALHKVIDPSHVRVYLADELGAEIAANVGPIETAVLMEPLQIGVEYIFTDVADRDAARAALQAELSGGPATGFEPARQGEEVLVTFHTALVGATRAS